MEAKHENRNLIMNFYLRNTLWNPSTLHQQDMKTWPVHTNLAVVNSVKRLGGKEERRRNTSQQVNKLCQIITPLTIAVFLVVYIILASTTQNWCISNDESVTSMKRGATYTLMHVCTHPRPHPHTHALTHIWYTDKQIVLHSDREMGW